MLGKKKGSKEQPIAESADKAAPVVDHELHHELNKHKGLVIDRDDTIAKMRKVLVSWLEIHGATCGCERCKGTRELLK